MLRNIVIIGAAVLVAVFLIIVLPSFLFMVGWNVFAAPTLSLPAIDFWQGLGAVILIIVVRFFFMSAHRPAKTVVEMKKPAMDEEAAKRIQQAALNMLMKLEAEEATRVDRARGRKDN